MRVKPFDWIKRSGEFIARPMSQYTVTVSKSDSFGSKYIVVVNGDEALMNGRRVMTFDNEDAAMLGAFIEFEKTILALLAPEPS